MLRGRDQARGIDDLVKNGSVLWAYVPIPNLDADLGLARLGQEIMASAEISENRQLGLSGFIRRLRSSRGHCLRQKGLSDHRA